MSIATSRLLDLLTSRTPTSRMLAERARQSFPSGVTHDARYLQPHPIYVQRAEGGRKWDVDGNEYVDYVGGHGALLLGHNHPAVMQAVAEQCALGTHYGSGHRLEIEWAELVQQLIPSAERIRFTNSGTEATLLALRLARAATGKTKIVRFTSNFHGWHDHAAFGVASHFDGTPTPGVLAAVAEQTLLCPPGDIEAIQRVCSECDDIAAVMLEPTGATWGQVPLPPAFLGQLRELTAAQGVLLIFDEVITGFRCSPGGAQTHFGITPDLTTLAKVLAGGFPGGAVCGRKDILDWLDFEASAALQREKIPHQGTFNANPVSAAAGVTTLNLVATTDACQDANQYAARLRAALQEVLQQESINWYVYGTFSGFHILTSPAKSAVAATDEGLPPDFRQVKASSASSVAKKLRLGMLAHGVDILGWPGGPTSAAHDDEDLERTVSAFRATLRVMKEEGDL